MAKPRTQRMKEIEAERERRRNERTGQDRTITDRFKSESGEPFPFEKLIQDAEANRRRLEASK